MLTVLSYMIWYRPHGHTLNTVQNWMTRLDNIRASANRWGWPLALTNVVVKRAARRWGIHVYKVRTREFNKNQQRPAIDSQYNIRKIEPDELKEFSASTDLDLSPDFVDSAIERGDLAFGAFEGPRLVSYIWRSVGIAPDADNVWIRVRKPFNYSYKAYTLDEYRGQRIGSRLFVQSDEEMRKLGYDYRVGIVGVTNFASLSMSKAIGSTIIGYAGYLAWFGKLFTFRSSQVKKIGFEFIRPEDSN